MEPYHQLSVPISSVIELAAHLKDIGFSTECLEAPTIVPAKLGFQTVAFTRADECAVYDVGAWGAHPDALILVYVNLCDNAQVEIRTHLETIGATWGYANF